MPASQTAFLKNLFCQSNLIFFVSFEVKFGLRGSWSDTGGNADPGRIREKLI